MTAKQEKLIRKDLSEDNLTVRTNTPEDPDEIARLILELAFEGVKKIKRKRKIFHVIDVSTPDTAYMVGMNCVRIVCDFPPFQHPEAREVYRRLGRLIKDESYSD